jgi:hypothetical protein
VVEIGDGAGFGQIGFGVFGVGHSMVVRHLYGHGAIQLVIVSQINNAKTTLSKDSFHPVATDVLGRGGWLDAGRRRQIHGYWLMRACAVEVVHGQTPPIQVLRVYGGL